MMRVVAVAGLLVGLTWGALQASAQDVTSAELGAQGYWMETLGRVHNGNPVGISSGLNIERDLSANEDTFGGAAMLLLRLEELYQFTASGWQVSGDGEATVDEDKVFGTLTIPAGTQVDTDLEMRYYTFEFIYNVISGRNPLRFGLGGSVKALNFDMELTTSTGEQEDLSFRAVYPTAELELGISFGEMIEIVGEASGGIPSFTKGGVEIQWPFEGRAGVRLRFGSVVAEAGFQLFKVELLEDENRPEEKRAVVNMNGIYYGVSVVF